MEKVRNSPQESPEFEVIDRRHFVNLDALPADRPAEVKPRYPTYVEELQARVAETERRFEEKKAEMHQEIARTRARLEAELEKRVELEKHRIALPMLEVLDNLQRALAASQNSANCDSLVEGIRMTTGLFHKKLQSLGVEPIECLNRPFNPDEQQAIALISVVSPELDGLVVDEVLPGYRMGDQVLRPAQVRVGRFQEPADDASRS
jgi:molecular chaperone GrpE